MIGTRAATCFIIFDSLGNARTGAELITRHCADDNDRELAMAAADRARRDVVDARRFAHFGRFAGYI